MGDNPEKVSNMQIEVKPSSYERDQEGKAEKLYKTQLDWCQNCATTNFLQLL